MATEPPGGLRVAGHPLSPEILESLKQASQATGVDFGFLVAQAAAESGLRGEVHARQRHSSAAGLFQFNAQTWLQMVKSHGAKYGLAAQAGQIMAHADGRLSTASRASAHEILDLRRDVRLSALLAAELAKQNAAALHKAFHRKAGPAELHLAHLLGASGAIRFLRARQTDAGQAAASVVPAAAKQNPQLFFERGDHTPHSVASVYGKVKARIETPLKQAGEATVLANLRPNAGLIDTPPKKPPGSRA
jgi:hypothetical protein